MTPSQATILVGLCDAELEFFHDADGYCYVSLVVRDHTEYWRIRSKAFRGWLGRQFFISQRAAPNAQALSDSLNELEGRALHDGPLLEVSLRVAELGDAIYIDLCDEAWRSIRIKKDGSGWSIDDDTSVRFIRRRGML